MPLQGLPSPLESVLCSFLEDYGLSSYKICSNPSGASVIIRFLKMSECPNHSSNSCNSKHSALKYSEKTSVLCPTRRDRVDENKVCLSSPFISTSTPNTHVSNANRFSSTRSKQNVFPKMDHVVSQTDSGVSTSSDLAVFDSIEPDSPCHKQTECAPVVVTSMEETPPEVTDDCAAPSDVSSMNETSDAQQHEHEYSDLAEAQTVDDMNIGEHKKTKSDVELCEIFSGTSVIKNYTKKLSKSTVEKINNPTRNRFLKRIAVMASKSTNSYNLMAETDDVVVYFNPESQTIFEYIITHGKVTGLEKGRLERFDKLPDFNHIDKPNELVSLKKATLDLFSYIASQPNH